MTNCNCTKHSAHTYCDIFCCDYTDKAPSWYREEEASTKPTERTYTEDQVIELFTQHLASVGHGIDIIYCEACRDQLKEIDFSYCADCKCENVCNSPRNKFHGRLCTDCANDAHDAAYGAHVDRQIDAMRGA